MLSNEPVFPIKTATLDQSEQDYIFNQQIKLAYKQFHICSLSSIGGIAIMPILLWNQVPQLNLFLWIGLTVFGLLIPPHILIHRYKTIGKRSQDQKYWAKWLIGIALLGSSAWGTQGFLLYTAHSTVHLFVVLLFITSGAFVSTIVATSYPPLFWAKITPIIVPFAVYSLFQNDSMQIVLGIGVLFFYGGALAIIYNNLHKNIMESLALRLEKSHLIKQLKLKNKIAEKASEDKSRFLAAASHDLRQPLHAQMLLVNELKEEAPESAALTKLEASMNAMNGLFNELLDISKLDAKVVTPKITGFSVNDLLDELAADFSVLAQKKNLEFRLRHCNIFIHSDRHLLSRILRNLTANAIKYTSCGSVLLSCRKRGNQAVFQVWDTGPGIPNNQSQLIFDEFYQLNNPERDRNKGLGLGLAIAHRLSQLLDHKLHLRSRVNKGSVFSVSCPISDNKEAANEIVAAATDLSQLNVLLVEDDELILTSTRELLLKWQCNLFAAGSIQGALNHVGSLINSGLNLIIADYRLKNNTTGMQVIDNLERILKKKIPAIIVTGDTSPEILKEICDSKRHLLHKPVSPEKLKNFINEVMLLEQDTQTLEVLHHT